MVSLDTILAVAPRDAREVIEEDNDTRAYLATVIEGKTVADAKRAIAPFLGMNTKALDAMFARLELDEDGPGDVNGTAPTANAAVNGVVKGCPPSPTEGPKKLAPAPTVTAYSQQSRFHSATVTTLSKDVDLRDVNLTIGELELLVDTRLWLKAGTHYGLVGRNGCGKSTLLGVLGDHSLVGFPANLRTLYVQQLDVEETDASVLDAVLAADAERQKRVDDVRAIEAALAEDGQPVLSVAIDSFVSRIAGERVSAAQKTATLRSGKRGKLARGAALKAEQTMLAAVRTEFGAGGDGDAPRADTEVAATILEKVYAELDEMGAHSAEARARSILTSLDVSERMQDGPVTALSGGWRMRVALAKAMFVQPDILLLDECTNHLDLAAIAWLQSYLVSLEDVTIVCVSHDRDFLNAVSEEIIRLKDTQLSYHPGNYDEYEEAEDELRKKKLRQHEALEKRREHVQKSIEKFKQHARSSNDDKVLGQVASRQKKLERMVGIDKTEDGKRFKVSYWAGFHTGVRPELELIKSEKEVDLRIPDPEPLRTAGPLVTLTSASFSYKGSKHRVLKSVSLALSPGVHVAILGLNGCGKSTLVGIMAGTLAPTHGHVTRAPNLRIGHYTQHYVDSLSSIADSALALLATQIRDAAPPHLDAPEPKEGDLRKWLGSFELSGALATRPVHTLSGGQRARVALALILHSQPHLLLLDEVTNHLDMYAVQGLVSALTVWTGTSVLITHDRHFVRETADEVYLLEGGRLTRLEEGVDEYVARFD